MLKCRDLPTFSNEFLCIKYSLVTHPIVDPMLFEVKDLFAEKIEYSKFFVLLLKFDPNLDISNIDVESGVETQEKRKKARMAKTQNHLGRKSSNGCPRSRMNVEYRYIGELVKIQSYSYWNYIVSI